MHGERDILRAQKRGRLNFSREDGLVLLSLIPPMSFSSGLQREVILDFDHKKKRKGGGRESHK